MVVGIVWNFLHRAIPVIRSSRLKMIPLLRPSVLRIVTKKSVYLEALRRHHVEYVQGQSPEPRVREYFYYIDHQGMLFLDDARMKNFTSCFKEKKFLAFFFKRLKRNDTKRYMKDFPYVSLCGPERNYVRCDDLPIVFTKIVEKEDSEPGETKDWFGYAHAEELLMVPFEPERLYMNVGSGRIYHPAPETAGGIGLIRSKIAIELSSLFSFEEGEENSPTHFVWKDKRYSLDSEWCKDKIMQAIR